VVADGAGQAEESPLVQGRVSLLMNWKNGSRSCSLQCFCHPCVSPVQQPAHAAA
jgi:hypothetical protein